MAAKRFRVGQRVHYKGTRAKVIGVSPSGAWVQVQHVTDDGATAATKLSRAEARRRVKS